VLLGGNLFASNPDRTWAAAALRRIPCSVSLTTKLNEGHVHGRGRTALVLPVLARDEEAQPTTQESMFNYVRISDGGPRRHEGPRSEVDVIATIADGVLKDSTPIDWQSMQNTGNIRAAISKVVPGFEKLGEIEKSKQEFQISNRTFHTPKFPTPSGKAVLHLHELPELLGIGPNEVRLMTCRSEGQFNTVVYEDYDLYRGIDRRDVILLHSDDLTRLNVQDGQRVTVKNATGEMRNILVVRFDQIRAGNALMYYPEANVLVPRVVDGQSKTPAFKNILVTVESTKSQAPNSKEIQNPKAEISKGVSA
jgi:anaerobic selenocysteine-containing dehydrogenase